MTGMHTNTMSVSGTFVIARMTNAAAPFSAAMKNSSGQWCANSVTSNRSFVIRPMIWPTFVLAKYVSDSFIRWSNASRRISVSMRAPMMWPVLAMK